MLAVVPVVLTTLEEVVACGVGIKVLWLIGIRYR